MDTPLSLSTHPNSDLQSLLEANQELLRENRLLRSLLGEPRPKTSARKKTAKPDGLYQPSLFPPDMAWKPVPE